ncbi:MAG TPA: porin [Verrucomicrobiota bacterium]|nr:porin [Verrucomicrobiota bacterium]
MKIHRTIALVAILGLLPVVGGLAAQETNRDIDVNALLQRIEELEQRVKIMDRKRELGDEAAAEKAKVTPTVSIGAGGLQVRSADSNFVFRFRGYVQADGRFYAEDESPNGNRNDTFLLRRVRPIFEGTVYERFDYRLMLDFPSGATASAANDVYVQDAYLNARILPQFQVQVGKFKEPVGLERLQSGANLLFIERAYPTQLVPNRDVGLQVHGDLAGGLLRYEAGVFNGVANGGSGDNEQYDDEKDFAARLFATPFIKSGNDWLRGLGVGVAGTYGHQDGPLRSFVTPGQQTFFSYTTGTGTNANVAADGKIWRVSPQAYYYKGPFGIFAEYALSSQHVQRTAAGTSVSETLRNTGWAVSASWFVTGEDNSFKAVTPGKPFTFGGEGWGALELTARYAQLNADNDTFPLYANPDTAASKASSWGVGANWHLNRNVKLSLDYEQTEFDGGNTDFLKDGEKVILTRAQFSF